MRKVILLFLTVVMFIPHNIINAEMSEEEVADIMIEKKHIPYEVVTATTYTVSAEETDSTPLITASGFKLDSLNPKKHKIIAVSRDLKRKYKFGQKVRVKGAGKLDGIYTVRDVMAKRWRKKIDILINPDDDGTKIRKVKIYNIETNLDK
jgi:3D (Asp-Asp-Asp) domain-containing protein